MILLFFILKLKLNYFKKQWKQKFVDKAKTIFINIYNHDYANKTNIISNNYDFLYEIQYFGENINYDDEFQVEEYLNKPIERMGNRQLNGPVTHLTSKSKRHSFLLL